MKDSKEQLWINDYLNGTLDEAGLREFEEELRSSAELRETFRAYLALDANLRQASQMLDLQKPASEMESSAEQVPSGKLLRFLPLVWSGAAAACVAFALSFAFFQSQSSGSGSVSTVATLIQADQCRWEGTELPTAVDSKLGQGVLSLVEGMATLRFDSGAEVTLEAPTRLEILTDMHCRLLEGSAIADVPESAHGFVIETPDLKVVDLGTRFGVTAGATGNSQVRVFEGEVDVHGLPEGASKRLKEGAGLYVDATMRPGDQEMPRQKPGCDPLQNLDGWTSIATSHGAGKDAYARRGDSHGPTGLHPLIMVKHTDLADGRTNERRAVITFDVSGMDLKQVEEAEIHLDFKASGLGFSALIPDSRFAVYGITHEALDHWDESTLLWKHVPGFTDEGPVDGQARKLVEFFIPRSGVSSPLIVRGSALVDFLRQDGNGLVTFVLVRETGETNTSGLVHAFATKEHPTGRPPLLRVK